MIVTSQSLFAFDQCNACPLRGKWESTYEAFGGHIGGSKTTGGLVAVNDQPRGAILHPRIVQLAFIRVKVYDRGRAMRTIWLRRFAAPRPVGPAPMTRTSTELKSSTKTTVSNCSNELLDVVKASLPLEGGGEVSLHIGVGHPAL